MAAVMSGVRRSRAEWQSLIERAAVSPLSISAFCAAQGVSTASFYLWRKRLSAGAVARASTPAAVPGQFIELGTLGIDPQGEEHAGGWDLELELGDGLVLRLRRR
jgi:hypothetical protein